MLLALLSCTLIFDDEIADKLGTQGEDGDIRDADGDGFTTDEGDCDDADPRAYPLADESCDASRDLNCDGHFGSADSDGDGFAACDECDDGNEAVHPGAPELCNDRDDDCDGSADDDPSNATTWYTDADGDGYGVEGSGVAACDALDGAAVLGGDCDDADATAHPATVWFLDADGDSYGSAAVTLAQCEQPGSYVADDSDCDDRDAAVNPAAVEVCNAMDDDCDTLADDDDASVMDQATWYADGDGDGFGDATLTATSCEQPAGFVSDDSDCDDSAASVRPDAAEVCDGIDKNCGSGIDEDSAIDATVWYVDSDGDSFGDSTVSATACAAPRGYVADATDCDDGDATKYPGAAEACDAADDDCNGWIDNDAPCDFGVQHIDDPACASYGHAYIVASWTYYDPEVWGDAVAYCESYGYEAVVIDDECEWDWIVTAVPADTTQTWWVGLYCASGACTSTAEFVWLDGSAGYVEWSGASYDASWDCAVVDEFMGGTKMWASAVRCDEQKGVICEAG